jgi:hypothetical protein
MATPRSAYDFLVGSGRLACTPVRLPQTVFAPKLASYGRKAEPLAPALAGLLFEQAEKLQNVMAITDFFGLFWQLRHNQKRVTP